MTQLRSFAPVLAALVMAAVPAYAQGGGGSRGRGIPPVPPPRVMVQRGPEQTQADAFKYTGDLGKGKHLILRSRAGNVTVTRGEGKNVEVSVTKTWRRGDPSAIKIEATRVRDGDVLLCARWTDDTQCDETHYESHGEPRNDARANFTIKLPPGAALIVNITLGDIDVTGSDGDVQAETVSGSISVDSNDGIVTAETVDGDIHVRATKLPNRGVSYKTVNGSITVALPEKIDAEIDARTLTGTISADFPVTVTGSVSPRRLHGTIGKGGPRLDLSTVHGSIRIERR